MSDASLRLNGLVRPGAGFDGPAARVALSGFASPGRARVSVLVSKKFVILHSLIPR